MEVGSGAWDRPRREERKQRRIEWRRRASGEANGGASREGGRLAGKTDGQGRTSLVATSQNPPRPRHSGEKQGGSFGGRRDGTEASHGAKSATGNRMCRRCAARPGHPGRQFEPPEPCLRLNAASPAPPRGWALRWAARGGGGLHFSAAGRAEPGAKLAAGLRIHKEGG